MQRPSITSNKSKNVSVDASQQMIDDLYNKSRDRESDSISNSRRIRTDLTPNRIKRIEDKDEHFNKSVKSMGFSEISQAFNTHFNKND